MTFLLQSRGSLSKQLAVAPLFSPLRRTAGADSEAASAVHPNGDTHRSHPGLRAFKPERTADSSFLQSRGSSREGLPQTSTTDRRRGDVGARSAVVVQQHTRTLVAVPRPGDVQDVPQDVAGKHLMRAKEADTVKAIDQLLQYKGWLCIPTPAEALHPSGGRIHHRGHADRAYVRAVLKIQIVNDGLGESHWIEAGAGSAQFMFCELKRPKANTSAQRRADQAHWQFEMRARGFVAYRCPDGCDDPLEDFRRFYRETWGEEL